jgi:hypothetical protein
MEMTIDRDERRSAVEAFGCPYRYDMLVNQGVDDTGDEAIRGRAFHACFLVYVLLLVAKGVTSDHDLALEAFPKGVAVTGLPDHLIAEVSDLFFDWAEGFELDVNAFLLAEDLLRRGRRRFQPDLVYAYPWALEVRDAKTYYRGLSEAQARRELQPRWYVVEAKRHWPNFPAYWFTFMFVRIGQTLTLKYTPDEVDALEPGVQAAIDAVRAADEKGEYPPMPGSHCTLCRLACPVVDDPRRMPIRLRTKEEAIQNGGLILTLEQRLKAARKAQKGWCEANGPVDVRGEVFTFRSSESVLVPADLAIDAIEAAYPRPEQLLVSMSAVKRVDPMRIARENRRLLEAAVRSQRWRFSHAKAGETDGDGGDDGETRHRLSEDE